MVSYYCLIQYRQSETELLNVGVITLVPYKDANNSTKQQSFLKVTDKLDIREIIDPFVIELTTKKIDSLTTLNKLIPTIKGQYKITYPVITQKEIHELFTEFIKE